MQNISKKISAFKDHIFRLVWTLAVAALTIEFAARFDDWVKHDAPLMGNYSFDQLFHLTAHGVRGVPNARYLHWRLNADGLNNPAIQPFSGQTRVFIYGASEAFGIYEGAGNDFPRVLERELNSNRQNIRFEVINGGTPGMRVGSGWLFLREMQNKLQARVVVIYPTPTHYIGVKHASCERALNLTGRTSYHPPELRITEKLKDKLKGLLPLTVMTSIRTSSISWQMRGKKTIDKIEKESLDVFKADLKCVVRLAKRLGMTPIIATHANRFGVDRQPGDAAWLTSWRRHYPEMHEDGFIDLELRANELIRTIASEEMAPVVDSATALGGKQELFADHAHFSEAGAAEMARLLAPYVKNAAEE